MTLHKVSSLIKKFDYYSKAIGLRLIPLCMILLTGVSAFATTYFVAPLSSQPTGNNCLSPQAACSTIQQAANKTQPGDIVYVMNGTYAPFYVPISGNVNANITYAAFPGHSPVIQLTTSSWFGIGVPPGVSYIVISGFKVIGIANQVSIQQAKAWAAQDYVGPEAGQSCIAVSGTLRQSNTHHITITSNEVSFCSGAGIYATHADYINVIANKVHDNAWWNTTGGSGISLFEQTDSDSSAVFKNFVMNNIVYANLEKVGHRVFGITDGNGILIDKNLKPDNTKIPYIGWTYIANNVVFNNGSTAIGAYYSQHVVIVNNTTYANNSVLNRGEIFIGDSNDNYVLNNIMYAASNKAVVTDWANTSQHALQWDYNIVYGGNALAFSGPHDIWADPRFVFPSTTPWAMLQVQYGSPAAGTGTSNFAPSTDINGVARKTNYIFRGAYQGF